MTRSPERILVTGAAGFIGSHVVERLLSLGATVIGLDNFDPFYSPAEKRANLAWAQTHPRFRLVVADCADRGALDAALAGESFDGIIHLAAKVGVRPSLGEPRAYRRANLGGTRSALELARRRGVGRVVLGSSSSVYGNAAAAPVAEGALADRPISPYAASKRAGELLCAREHRRHGLGVLVLRFFTVYGPRQRPDMAMRRFGTLMLQGAPLPLYGDGSSARDYTWVDDIVDGVVAALRRTREVPGEYAEINLGGNRTTTLIEVVELLGAALGVVPRIRHLPAQPGDVARTWADITTARRLLGYAPRTTLEDGVTRFAAWLRDRVAQAGAAPAAGGLPRPSRPSPAGSSATPITTIPEAT